MTLSPDERAKALLDALLDAGTIEQLGPANPVPIIADAIRQAEEAAVQRVLAAIESAHDHVAPIAIMRIRENDPTLLKDTPQ